MFTNSQTENKHSPEVQVHASEETVYRSRKGAIKKPICELLGVSKQDRCFSIIQKEKAIGNCPFDFSKSIIQIKKIL